MSTFNIPSFNNSQLISIYKKYCNLSYNYFTKYEKILDYVNLPEWENMREGYKPNEVAGAEIVWQLLDFKEWIAKYNIKPDRYLSANRDIDPEEMFLTWNYKYIADFEEDSVKHDLHALDLPEKDFDFFLFCNTLEHLYNPLIAMHQISKHIKPGGYVFTSVPVVNFLHGMPFHFQGITPFGLVMLFIMTGFEPLEVGQFGNAKYAECLFEDGRTNYKFVMDDNGLMKNDPFRPMHTWCLARKI